MMRRILSYSALLAATLLSGCIHAQSTNSNIFTVIPKTDRSAVGQLRLQDKQATPHYLTVEAADSMSADIHYKFMGADAVGYLYSDGAGNLSLSAGTSTVPGGGNTNIQYNCSGAFCGSSGFTYNGSSSVLLSNLSGSATYSAIGSSLASVSLNAFNGTSAFNTASYKGSSGSMPEGFVWSGSLSRGSVGVPAALHTGDVLFDMQGSGDDGVLTNRLASQLQFLAGSLWTASNHDAHMSFSVVAPGTTTLSEAWRVAGDGNISYVPVTINGALTLTSALNASDYIKFYNGASLSMMLSSVGSTNKLNILNGSSTVIAYFDNSGNFFPGHSSAIGAYFPSVITQTTDASEPSLIVLGANSQTGDIFDVEDVATTKKLWVDSSGNTHALGLSVSSCTGCTSITAGAGISVSGTTVSNSGVLSVNGATGAVTGIMDLGSAQTVTGVKTFTAALATQDYIKFYNGGSLSMMLSSVSSTNKLNILNGASTVIAYFDSSGNFFSGHSSAIGAFFPSVITQTTDASEPSLIVLGANSQTGDIFDVEDVATSKKLWVDSSGNTHALGLTVSSCTGCGTTYLAGTGISISGPTITNTGIISLSAGTGISVSGSTITNTGITSLTAGSGISVSGSTITNSGVLSLNGSTGAITGIMDLGSAQTVTGVKTFTSALATQDYIKFYNGGSLSMMLSSVSATNKLNILNGASTTIASFDSSGNFFSGHASAMGVSLPSVIAQTTDSAEPSMIVLGTNSQSGDIFDVEDVFTSKKLWVDSSGNTHLGGTLVVASGATFNGGITTGSSTSSTLYVGSGNFYLRTFSGAPSCGGVTDGWAGYDTSGDVLYICNGGVAKAH